MNGVTWKCHVDDSDKGGYIMILERDPLTSLSLMIDLLKYIQHPWYILIQGKLLLNNCLLMLTLKRYISQSIYILLQGNYVDAKYKKVDLHKVM